MRRKLARRIKSKIYSNIDNYGKISRIALKALSPLSEKLKAYRISPVCWMDESRPYRSGMLRASTPELACSPDIINSRSRRLIRVDAPPLHWRHFRNATVSAESSSVLDCYGTLNIERAGRGSQSNFNYAGGFLKRHGNLQAVLKFRNTQRIEKGIFFGGNGSSNYYHWLIEIVSRSEFINDLPGDYDDYPILVSEVVTRIPAFQAIASIAAKGRKIRYLSTTEPYEVDDLIYIDTPNSLPINLANGTWMDACDFMFRADSIKHLREMFCPPESTQSSSIDRHRKTPRKIFLARDNERRSFNQSEIEHYLVNRGFVSIQMETLPFAEQIRWFSGADWIIGPTGAAWANLVFANRGTNCLCWMAEEFGDFAAFSTIAFLTGANLRYLNYETGAKSMYDLYVSGYHIELDAVESAIEALSISDQTAL